MPPPFITRVRLKNYKSIGYCDVELQALTFLVGPNGSGKSNFLDAIRFVSDALRQSLDQAIRARGGVNQMSHRFADDPAGFSIWLDIRLSETESGSYSFEIENRPDDLGFTVKAEQCRLYSPSGTSHYHVQNGIVSAFTAGNAPPAASDRLFLVNASGFPPFRLVYDALSQMGFYNINPDQVRSLQPAGSGSLLLHDASNVSAVLDRMFKNESPAKERLEQFLAAIVPGLIRADSYVLGGLETVSFRQVFTTPRLSKLDRVLQIESSSPASAVFLAHSMSDGTLRALGVLVALFQFGLGRGNVPHLIGIEEPESALHPAAAGVLFDAIQDASERLQVIITSHSPELLEDKSLSVESILAVVSENGETQIAPIDEASRDMLRDRLVTAGELLRIGHLTPDPEAVERGRTDRRSFFEAPAE